MITALKKYSPNDPAQMVHIENMEMDDLDEILVIEQASFPTPWSRNLFIQELHNPLSRNRVAKMKQSAADEIAGYMSYWVVADEVHLQHIATREDLRRSGIGAGLLVDMMEKAFREGARHATLEVRRTNVAAINLYENYAFTVKGVRRGYYDDTHEDALIMWAEIGESGK